MVTDDPQPIQPEPEQPPSEQPLGGQPPKRKRPRMRRRWVVLIALASVVAVLIIAAFVAAHYTSRSSFCNTCHEMEPYYASWSASSHSTAECRDCHIPPGVIPYVETKLFSLREVWVHVTGGADAPLAVTREIPNGSCYRCHTTPADTTIGGVAFSHEQHEDEFCIDCHVRFVHTDVNPPEYRSPATMAACQECHNGGKEAGECSVCHTAPHEPRGECANCHTISGWTPTTFTHPQVGEHIPNGDRPLQCTDCHTAGFDSYTCSCHGGTPPIGGGD